MKRIPVGKRLFALVDDEDFVYLSHHTWRAESKNYVRRHVPRKYEDTMKVAIFHRVIAGASGSEIVDHIDGNPLNNQRVNLRLCTFQQNLWNKQQPSKSRSGYYGVGWNKKVSKWNASFKGMKSGKPKVMHIGYFKTTKEAAIAYDEVILRERKEFARTNILPNPYPSKHPPRTDINVLAMKLGVQIDQIDTHIDYLCEGHRRAIPEIGFMYYKERLSSIQELPWGDDEYMALEGAIKSLGKRDQKIIKMRYGIEGKRRYTLGEVGEKFAVTRECIRQWEEKAVERLRFRLHGTGLYKSGRAVTTGRPERRPGLNG